MNKYKWIFLTMSVVVVGALAYLLNKPQRHEDPLDEELRRVLISQYRDQGRTQLMKELKEKNCIYNMETQEMYAYLGPGQGFLKCVARTDIGVIDKLIRSMEEVKRDAEALAKKLNLL